MCQSTAIYPSFFLFTFNKLTILTIQIKNIQWRQISYIFKMETLHMRASCYMDLFAIIYRMELEFYVKNKSKEKRVFSLYAWCSFCIQALDLGACSTVTALRQICTPYDHNSWLESLQGLGIVCLCIWVLHLEFPWLSWLWATCLLTAYVLQQATEVSIP